MKFDSSTTKQQWKDWVFATLREAAWAPLSVFGFYLFGLAFDWYDLYPPLDIPTHFMGGVVITYFYRVAIYHAQKIVGGVPLAIRVLLAFTSTGTTTIFWEFYENILDFFFDTQMVRGLEDTILDMFLGLSGALVLSLLYRRR